MVVGPGRLQTMGEILHGLIALTVPDHEACHCAAYRSSHPKHCFHSFRYLLHRSLDVSCLQFVLRQEKGGWHVNWCHGSGEVRTGVGIRSSARRKDAGAGRRSCERSKPGTQQAAEPSSHAVWNPGIDRAATHSRRPNPKGGRNAGKDVAGDASRAIFERCVAAGNRCVLRVGRVHDGNGCLEGAGGVSFGGELVRRDEGVRLCCRVRAVYLLHGKQLRASGAEVGGQHATRGI